MPKRARSSSFVAVRMTILLVIKNCVGGEGCLLDLLEGDGVLGGGGATVFKLGGNISNAALFAGVEA